MLRITTNLSLKQRFGKQKCCFNASGFDATIRNPD